MILAETLSEAKGELDEETLRELTESARPYGEQAASTAADLVESGGFMLLAGGLSILRGLRAAKSGRKGAFRALALGVLLIGIGLTQRRIARPDPTDRTNRPVSIPERTDDTHRESVDNPAEPTTLVDGVTMGADEESAVDVNPEFEMNEPEEERVSRTEERADETPEEATDTGGAGGPDESDDGEGDEVSDST